MKKAKPDAFEHTFIQPYNLSIVKYSKKQQQQQGNDGVGMNKDNTYTTTTLH